MNSVKSNPVVRELTTPNTVKTMGVSLGVGVGAAAVIALIGALIISAGSSALLSEILSGISSSSYMTSILSGLLTGPNFLQLLVLVLLCGVSGSFDLSMSVYGTSLDSLMSVSVTLPVGLSGVALMVGAAFGAYWFARKVGVRFKWTGAISAVIVGAATGLVYVILGALFPISLSTYYTDASSGGSFTFSGASFKTFAMAFIISTLGSLFGYFLAQFAPDSSNMFLAAWRWMHRARGFVRTLAESVMVYAVVYTVVSLVLIVVLAVEAETPTVFALIPFVFPLLPFLIFALSSLGALSLAATGQSISISLYSDTLEIPAWLSVVLVVVFVLSTLYIALRASARNIYDRTYANWTHSWKSPVVAAVAWLLASLCATQFSVVYSVSGSSGAVYFGLATWYFVLAAVWAFLVDVVALSFGPTLLAAMPALWRLFVGGTVQLTPRSITDYVIACGAVFTKPSSTNMAQTAGYGYNAANAGTTGTAAAGSAGMADGTTYDTAAHTATPMPNDEQESMDASVGNDAVSADDNAASADNNAAPVNSEQQDESDSTDSADDGDATADSDTATTAHDSSAESEGDTTSDDASHTDNTVDVDTGSSSTEAAHVAEAPTVTVSTSEGEQGSTESGAPVDNNAINNGQVYSMADSVSAHYGQSGQFTQSGYAAAVPPMPSAQRKPMTAKQKMTLIIVGVVAAIAIALGIAYTALNATIFSPTHVAEEYLSAIASGDYDEANNIAGTQLDEQQSVLLTNEAAQADNATISNAQITSVEKASDGSAIVSVSYTIDGSTVTDSFTMVSSGSQFLVFSDWTISTPLIKQISVYSSSAVSELDINGVTVTADNAVSSSTSDTLTFLVYPGTYTVSVADSTYITSDSLSINTSEASTMAYLEVEATDALIDELQTAVDDLLQTCVASTDADPEGCPFGMWYTSDRYRNYEWSISESPEVDYVYLDSGTFSTGYGTAQVSYEYQYYSSDTWEEYDSTDVFYVYGTFVIEDDEVTVSFDNSNW